VYTQSHADYVVEVFEEIVTQRERLRGLRIVQQPAQLRHFTAQFAPLWGSSGFHVGSRGPRGLV
jgi:tryptophanase